MHHIKLQGFGWLLALFRPGWSAKNAKEKATDAKGGWDNVLFYQVMLCQIHSPTAQLWGL